LAEVTAGTARADAGAAGAGMTLVEAEGGGLGICEAAEVASVENEGIGMRDAVMGF